MDPAPVQLTPRPLSGFENGNLRDSIAAALAGVPADHGHAVLEVDNKGAGLMLVQRFDDEWALLIGGRYTFEDRGIRATVAVSW